MRFGSVCSGIEAASVAWKPLGWQAAWLSEIEPFPSAVLNHHYPDVPNLGDMTTLPARIAAGEVEAPDLFCGGTPCQAFSVAGLRQSLGDARGNLSLTFCEIANAIDNARSVRGLDPSIVFWENVPGVLSTQDNAFGCFLGALAGEDDALIPPGGRWTNAGFIDGPQRAVAWRVLDAQYFGVAQRRRRVFVVASARADFDPAAVLFEFDGVRRDTAPSREAGERVAPCVTNGPPFSRTGNERVECEAIITMAHGQGGAEIGFDRGPTLTCNHEAPIAAYPVTQFGDVAGTLTARHDSSPCADRGMNVVAQPIALQDVTSRQKAQNGKGWNDDGASYTVDTHATQGVAQPIGIFQDSEFGVQQYDSAGTLRAGRIPEHQMVMQPVNIYGGNKRSDRPEGGFYVRMNEDVSKTLDAATGLNPTCSQGGTAVMQPVAFHPTQDPISSTEMCHSIGANENPTAVAFQVGPQSGEFTDVAPTLDCRAKNGPIQNQLGAGVMQAMQVRRLTPVECERLQGFPDNYTAIPWRKKPASECPDGPRYKALGNSWAVPVVRWIGERIAKAA